jgi:hypothetical protein
MRCMVDANETDRSLWKHVYTRTEGWTNIHETVSFISVGVGVLIFSLCILMHSLTVLHILGRALCWLEVLIPDDVI